MNKINNPEVINKFANRFKKGDICAQETSFEIIKDESGHYFATNYIDNDTVEVEPAILIYMDYTDDDISVLFDENHYDYICEIDNENFMGFNQI